MLCSSRVSSTAFLSLFAAIGAACPAVAQLDAYEPFNYTSGVALSGQGGTTDIGFSSNWASAGSFTASVGSASLAYPSNTFPLTPTGNDAVENSDGTAQGALSRNLTTSFGDTTGAGTYWVSALVDPINKNYSNLITLNTGASTYVDMGWGGGGASGTGKWLIGTNATSVTGSVSVATGTTVLAVAQINFSGGLGTDSAEIYLNPGSTQPSTSSAVATITGQNFGQVTALGIHWAANADIDELRIASNYADVAGTAPAPSALVTAAMGATPALLALRRKRRRA